MRYSSKRKVPDVSKTPETSVPPDIMDIVGQLKELTEAGRLTWDEARTGRGIHSVAVSLASGRWRVSWHAATKSLNVTVWDDEGTSIFSFTVNSADPHFASIKAVYDVAVRKNREQNTSRALAKMREELATR